MFKKIIASGAAAALALAAVPALAVDQDVAEQLKPLGIMTEYFDGGYADDGIISRGEAAALSLQIIGCMLDPNGKSVFSDVPVEHWAADWIDTAVRYNTMDGCGDGTFRPDDPLTYEQAVKLVVSALGYNSEAEALGGWPMGYLAVAANMGLTLNTGGVIGQPITRQGMARLIYNAIDVPMMEQVSWGVDGKKYAVNEDLTLRKQIMWLSQD